MAAAKKPAKKAAPKAKAEPKPEVHEEPAEVITQEHHALRRANFGF